MRFVPPRWLAGDDWSQLTSKGQFPDGNPFRVAVQRQKHARQILVSSSGTINHGVRWLPRQQRGGGHVVDATEDDPLVYVKATGSLTAFSFSSMFHKSTTPSRKPPCCRTSVSQFLQHFQILSVAGTQAIHPGALHHTRSQERRRKSGVAEETTLNVRGVWQIFDNDRGLSRNLC